MSDAVLAVIPARYASTRLPGKPLVDLAGKPMIQWVWQAVAASTKVHRVVVATDDERIATVVGGFGGEVVMTDPELPSGTDRCAAAARSIGWESAGYVLNIQGDEPLLPTSLVDDLVDAVVIGGADVVTPICRLTNPADLTEPSIVTVALNSRGEAMYFSRSPIPHYRGVEMALWPEHHQYWKHIGLYGYTADALQRHVALQQHPLELAESLEQLRLLADGARIRCIVTEAELVAVDTPADAERVYTLLAGL